MTFPISTSIITDHLGKILGVGGVVIVAALPATFRKLPVATVVAVVSEQTVVGSSNIPSSDQPVKILNFSLHIGCSSDGYRACTGVSKITFPAVDQPYLRGPDDFEKHGPPTPTGRSDALGRRLYELEFFRALKDGEQITINAPIYGDVALPHHVKLLTIGAEDLFDSKFRCLSQKTSGEVSRSICSETFTFIERIALLLPGGK